LPLRSYFLRDHDLLQVFFGSRQDRSFALRVFLLMFTLTYVIAYAILFRTVNVQDGCASFTNDFVAFLFTTLCMWFTRPVINGLGTQLFLAGRMYTRLYMVVLVVVAIFILDGSVAYRKEFNSDIQQSELGAYFGIAISTIVTGWFTTDPLFVLCKYGVAHSVYSHYHGDPAVAREKSKSMSSIGGGATAGPTPMGGSVSVGGGSSGSMVGGSPVMPAQRQNTSSSYSSGSPGSPVQVAGASSKNLHLSTPMLQIQNLQPVASPHVALQVHGSIG